MISRRTRLIRGAFGLALVAIFGVAYVVHPYLREDDHSVCSFRNITGLPCVFCGLTHALASATHGEWQLASHYHPLWWVACAAIVTTSLLSLTDGLCGTDILGCISRTALRYGWPLVAGVVLFSFSRAFWP